MNETLTYMVRIFPLKMCFIIAHHLLQIIFTYITLPILVKSIEHDAQRTISAFVLLGLSPVRFFGLAACLTHCILSFM